MENLLLLMSGLCALVIAYMVGNEMGERKMRRINNKAKREELKKNVSDMPYDYMEDLEVAFEKGNDMSFDDFKYAALFATTVSGNEYIVDYDFRDTEGNVRDLKYYDTYHRDYVNSILENVDAINFLYSTLDNTSEDTDIEKYDAFQNTINDIYRGRHWFSGNSIAMFKVKFIDINYCELKALIDPANVIKSRYFDPEYNTITATEKMFNKVDSVISKAADSLEKLDQNVKDIENVIYSINSIGSQAKSDARICLRIIEELAENIVTSNYVTGPKGNISIDDYKNRIGKLTTV